MMPVLHDFLEPYLECGCASDSFLHAVTEFRHSSGVSLGRLRNERRGP